MNWLQRHWDARAAANFMLGGAGSGLIVLSVLVQDRNATLLGMLLMAAGLGAVWLETGRKLRALHVFFNPFTSWMTRESFAAVAVFVMGPFYFISRNDLYLYGTVAAAVLFLYCQARILRASKGIPAWRAPEAVPLIVCTGLAEGAGLALLFSQETPLLVAFVAALTTRFLAWQRYRAAVKSEALEPAGRALAWIGTAAALAFLPVAPLAGIAALATGWWLKFALVTRASLNQGFSLPHLPVRGTR